MLFKAIFFAETAILRLIKYSFINYTLGYNTFGYNFVTLQRINFKSLKNRKTI